MKTENISAFMDNEADAQVEKEILSQWKSDSSVREKWNQYHLIGEVVRDREVHHVNLTNRIFDALADEPTVFVPQKKRQATAKDPSVNKWVAIAAAIFVVIISTQTFKQGSFKFSNTQATQASLDNPAVTQSVASADALPSKYVNSYVNLHRQWSPFTDIQTVDYNAGVVVSK
ncbi:anti-RNA polymerase sigma factor SigE [Ferrovum sp. JA12]|uniref:sigma-E factor negative regulatory protein n=1 Tax=Ferrovum sp. JA12 TaxID=1356299 RepID=UPI00070349C0|nr:sigma-E factor negative regulatory protein [Ferrovum sp. JA12]KRH78738.1 anti-RNA polymerase sigma factor SigE [Ferrovum sp. JA12]